MSQIYSTEKWIRWVVIWLCVGSDKALRVCLSLQTCWLVELTSSKFRLWSTTICRSIVKITFIGKKNFYCLIYSSIDSIIQLQYWALGSVWTQGCSNQLCYKERRSTAARHWIILQHPDWRNAGQYCGLYCSLKFKRSSLLSVLCFLDNGNKIFVILS